MQWTGVWRICPSGNEYLWTGPFYEPERTAEALEQAQRDYPAGTFEVRAGRATEEEFARNYWESPDRVPGEEWRG